MACHGAAGLGGQTIWGRDQLGSPWAVVVCEPGRDAIAERSLKRAGWRCFFPTYQKLLRTKTTEDGRRIGTRNGGDLVPRPLFPGYGFTELWPDQQWRHMRDATGILGFLLKGERPAIIDEDIIEELRSAMNDGRFDDARPRSKRTVRSDIRPGNVVRINAGPFTGLIGHLQSLDDQNRARVLVEMFGRPSPANVDDANTLELVAS